MQDKNCIIQELVDAENISYELAYRDYTHFFKRAWRILERKQLLFNWHHDVICEYLQACYKRDIKRLIINIPPRYTKSLLATVIFPVWVWAHDPSERFLFSSYAQTLSTYHSKKRRDVIESEWFQKRWGREFLLTTDKETEIENNKTGHMIATSMHGHATGKGGNWIIIDDPHNAEDVMSDKKRSSDIESYDQKFITRLDDSDKGVIIIIMQRLHEGDLTGHLLGKDEHWEHLCIPSIETKTKTYSYPISQKKYERHEGEVLHAKRHDRHKLDQLSNTMGVFKFVGQYQQNPTPPEGGIIKRAYWQYYNRLPEHFDELLDSWDMTFKDLDTSDYVVGTVWGRTGANCYLLHMTRKQMGFTDSLRSVLSHREKFTKLRKTLIEDKANGTGIIEVLKRKVSGILEFSPGDKSKLERVYMVQHIFESGNVFLPVKQIATFNTDEVIDEFAKFPKADHDDIVDSCTQALIKLDKQQTKTITAMGLY